jgi:hypothetical protein
VSMGYGCGAFLRIQSLTGGRNGGLPTAEQDGRRGECRIQISYGQFPIPPCYRVGSVSYDYALVCHFVIGGSINPVEISARLLWSLEPLAHDSRTRGWSCGLDIEEGYPSCRVGFVEIAQGLPQ